MFKLCPIKGCYRLVNARVIYNGIEKECCKKHMNEVKNQIREEIRIKKAFKKQKKMKTSVASNPSIMIYNEKTGEVIYKD